MIQSDSSGNDGPNRRVKASRSAGRRMNASRGASRRVNPLEAIRERRPALSGKLLALADFVSQHHRRVAFMSARELAREAGVSLPTVVRFVSRVAFPGYQPFVRSIRELVNLELSGVERLETPRAGAAPPLHETVITREIEALRQLLAGFPLQEVRAVAARLARAPAVGVAAVRYLSPLAHYAAYTLHRVRPGVLAFPHLDSAARDELALLPRGSVLLAVGLPRYAAELVAALEFARGRSLTIVALTDHLLSPVARLADHILLVPAPPMKFIGHLAAPAALLNILVSEVALRRQGDAVRRFNVLEEVAHARGTFQGAGERKDYARLLAARADGRRPPHRAPGTPAPI